LNRFDAIGFGALNVDKLFLVEKIAGPDEETSVIDYSETCGGSAANAMVGLARLGCKVGFIGKTASDYEGRMLLHDFRRERVDTKGIVRTKDGRSGKVMGFVDADGQRALYVDAGVNDVIKPKDVDLDYASNTRLLHLTSFVGEQSFETQKWLLNKIPSRIQVSFDPGALYAKMGMAKLLPIIDRTSIMLPSADELEMITGKNDYAEGAKLLLDHGVKIVAVKLGNAGCYVTDGKEKHKVTPFKVKVVDTTGAGDAFDAGFLYGILGNMTLKEAARIGNFIASKCIMVIGARPGLPKLKILKKEMSK
jgi:ribokinase